MAIVGAGSLVFTRTLVTDLLYQEATEGSELRLVDIDPARLRGGPTVRRAPYRAGSQESDSHCDFGCCASMSAPSVSVRPDTEGADSALVGAGVLAFSLVTERH
jgi:hypothetical protein